MRIVITATTEDKAYARSVLTHFSTIGISAQAFTIKENWKESSAKLDDLAAATSHIIIIYTAASANSSWLSFLAGYCMGSEKPLVLYRPQRTTNISIFLASCFAFNSLEDLASYLEAEAKEWSSVAKRREARKALLDFGIPFNDESFADVVNQGNVQAAELFLRAGLSPDTRDRRGTPLVCLAARKGQGAMLRLLLDAGTHIDLQSVDRGNSALMDAVAAGDEKAVSLLLEAGASTEIVSKNGQSALILAVGRKSLSLVKLLLKYGANPTLEDNIGLNAKKYAVLFNSKEIIELL